MWCFQEVEKQVLNCTKIVQKLNCIRSNFSTKNLIKKMPVLNLIQIFQIKFLVQKSRKNKNWSKFVILKFHFGTKFSISKLSNGKYGRNQPLVSQLKILKYLKIIIITVHNKIDWNMGKTVDFYCIFTSFFSLNHLIILFCIFANFSIWFSN